ncbi:putative effector protein [Ceratobasidium theobromae]|uniref:Putative effector protein n=1 Tax=Ceratobasidium theobromae TaxID=1582974 RepID=A0A5N5QAZ5_9AGAM|nr:putative effector protein [Ceratobasidium theobromae]
MFTFSKLSLLVVSTFGIASSALAVPVESRSNSTLVARGPFDVHNGWATWYNPSEDIGACGQMHYDSELVAAIGHSLYEEMMVDGNPNHGKACGKTAKVTWKGKSVTVKIVDMCMGCGDHDIDLSPAAFQKLADLDVGQLVGTSWKFN